MFHNYGLKLLVWIPTKGLSSCSFRPQNEGPEDLPMGRDRPWKRQRQAPNALFSLGVAEASPLPTLPRSSFLSDDIQMPFHFLVSFHKVIASEMRQWSSNVHSGWPKKIRAKVFLQKKSKKGKACDKLVRAFVGKTSISLGNSAPLICS